MSTAALRPRSSIPSMPEGPNTTRTVALLSLTTPRSSDRARSTSSQELWAPDRTPVTRSRSSSGGPSCQLPGSTTSGTESRVTSPMPFHQSAAAVSTSTPDAAVAQLHGLAVTGRDPKREVRPAHVDAELDGVVDGQHGAAGLPLGRPALEAVDGEAGDHGSAAVAQQQAGGSAEGGDQGADQRRLPAARVAGGADDRRGEAERRGKHPVPDLEDAVRAAGDIEGERELVGARGLVVRPAPEQLPDRGRGRVGVPGRRTGVVLPSGIRTPVPGHSTSASARIGTASPSPGAVGSFHSTSIRTRYCGRPRGLAGTTAPLTVVGSAPGTIARSRIGASAGAAVDGVGAGDPSYA